MNNIEKVQAAIDYIEDHLTEKLDLDVIASAVHYSKYHLHRVFSKTVGLTLHEYRNRRQLTEAAKLLVFSEGPILDIALLAGYESQQAFTTAFSAMYKQSPSQYRENEKFYPLQLRLQFEGSYNMRNSTEKHSGRSPMLTRAISPVGWPWFTWSSTDFRICTRRNMSVSSNAGFASGRH